MKLRRSIKPLSGPLDPVAPVNVVLLLLAFFLLSSVFVMQSGVRVTLPTAFAAAGIRDVRYVINVAAGNPPRIFFNNRVVTADELEVELKELAAKQPNAVAVLRADQGVPYGTVMDVIGRAFNAGVGIFNATATAAP